MPIHFIRSLLLLPLTLLLLLPITPASDFLIHCQWLNPNTHVSQTLTFASNPLTVVLPGESLRLTATLDRQSAMLSVLKNDQLVSRDDSLSFTAPEKPGAHYIHLVLESSGKREERELCVVVPYKGVGRKSSRGIELVVDDEEMGEYRSPSLSGNRKVRDNPQSYQPPVWWLRITPNNGDFEIVPGVRVSELVAVTEETGLRHTDLVPVSYPMWSAIVSLRMGLERRGIPGGALKLISMFRTPSYNRMIGSNAFGRHVYGDAFDFYIDLVGGIKASDLNGDGRLDRRDAYRVVSVIEDLQAEDRIPMGGIGVYNTRGGDHEVTMHLDMRGHRATWGYLYSVGGKRSEFSWLSERFSDLDRVDEEFNARRALSEGREYVRPKREPLH